MNDEFAELFAGLELNAPASEHELQALSALRHPVPVELVNFFRFSNGYAGLYAEQYIHIYSIGDFAFTNRIKENDEYYPNLLMFASDGGNMGFAYDFSLPGNPVVDYDQIGDMGCVIAPNFVTFLRMMKTIDMIELTEELRVKRYAQQQDPFT